MNYKLFNAARDKSAMNYQKGRFDMEFNFNIDPSSDRRTSKRLTSCPRHSHNKLRSANLPDIRLKNTTVSTVSCIFLFYYKLVSLILVSKDQNRYLFYK